MTRRRVVIVGNGAAAVSALEAFRRLDPRSEVAVVSAEPHPAYSRVLLPYYLRRIVPYAHLFIRDAGFYRDRDADLLLGTAVEQVDVRERRLSLADGRSLPFDRLLLAPGSSPVRPPIAGLGGPNVHHLWRLDEAGSLDLLLREGARALVLGSGFVALQAAWAARQRGLAVTVVELAERILPRVLDEAGARILSECIRACGVVLHTATRTEGLTCDRAGRLQVTAEGVAPFEVEVVVVGTGVRPNDHMLPGTGAAATPGVVVDHRMRTPIEDVFAAGDVARGPVVGGGPPEIHALWPTAVEQGAVAGANMAGVETLYPGSLNMNVTEMFGLTVASLGRFVAEEGDTVERHGHLPGVRYLSVVVREGVPVGAVALGGAAAARALGYLRPYVRRRARIDDIGAVVSGAQVVRGLAFHRGGGRPTAGSHRSVAPSTLGPIVPSTSGRTSCA